MRGSSGAAVILFARYARKEGDARVGAQGKWLITHPAPTLPHVFAYGDNWYHMELLDEIEPNTLDILDILAALEPVWCKKPVVQFDYDLAKAHVLGRAVKYAPEVLKSVCYALDFIDIWSERLPAHLTHGDPTYDNAMVRPGIDELVLIDPLPAQPYAPDLLPVDLGKILQSMAGYEHDRYGTPGMPTLERGLQKLNREYNNVITDTAVHFALIHLVRALPYLDEAARDRVRQGSLNLIRKVADEV